MGDLGYGAVLLIISLALAKGFPPGRLTSDIGKILGVASIYTLVFGVLYGEFFGDLGEHWLGLHPAWFDRGKAVLPMAIFAVSVGVMHVLLGISLGVITSYSIHYTKLYEIKKRC